jgi:hypothetical protein
MTVRSLSGAPSFFFFGLSGLICFSSPSHIRTAVELLAWGTLLRPLPQNPLGRVWQACLYALGDVKELLKQKETCYVGFLILTRPPRAYVTTPQSTSQSVPDGQIRACPIYEQTCVRTERCTCSGSTLYAK